MEIPEWVKVKLAAVVGLGTSAVAVEKLDVWLDIIIKLGQVGVLVATILYTVAKWRAARAKRKAAEERERQ